MKYEITADIQLEKITYNVDFETGEKLQKVIITPLLKIQARKKGFLVASLNVDGHELLPSARVNIDNGVCEETLPSVNIMRRKTPGTTFDEHPSIYKLELVVMKDSDHYITDTRKIDLKDY